MQKMKLQEILHLNVVILMPSGCTVLIGRSYIQLSRMMLSQPRDIFQSCQRVEKLIQHMLSPLYTDIVMRLMQHEIMFVQINILLHKRVKTPQIKSSTFVKTLQNPCQTRVDTTRFGHGNAQGFGQLTLDESTTSMTKKY